MTTSNTSGKTAAPEKREVHTESDAKSIDGNSGESKNSSHDEKSHTKAGKNEGAGGGKKQERKH